MKIYKKVGIYGEKVKEENLLFEIPNLEIDLENKYSSEEGKIICPSCGYVDDDCPYEYSEGEYTCSQCGGIFELSKEYSCYYNLCLVKKPKIRKVKNEN